jgi:hypothetical protein
MVSSTVLLSQPLHNCCPCLECLQWDKLANTHHLFFGWGAPEGISAYWKVSETGLRKAVESSAASLHPPGRKAQELLGDNISVWKADAEQIITESFS